eukprot:TRINITY_DN2362_c0_g1_i1.p3 TRINITY_DN2362_c0_g1~~TRINITY_DN2362_c0_g1_i1.p3  ORF type:complete len:130 (-),score=31.67 TRINITY_DN2362_c0_g1_i1:57-446(-)
MEGCVAPDALARVLLGEADVPAWAAREGARVAVVDVRGNMTRKIVGARQVAAHEFLRSVDAYVAELSGVDAVVFHCQHSKVRGPMCAARFAERLREKSPESAVKVLVLTGGFIRFDHLFGTDPRLVVHA